MIKYLCIATETAGIFCLYFACLPCLQDLTKRKHQKVKVQLVTSDFATSTSHPPAKPMSVNPNTQND